jgi:cytoskeletal protein RodZ
MDVWGAFSPLACSLALLGMLGGTLPASAQQSGPPAQSQATERQSASEVDKTGSLPDSPDTVRFSSPDQQAAEDSIASLEEGQSASNSAPAAQTTPLQKPVGTAAAEAGNANAIAASQPAGVAIAPAKQHRVRTIILKTGAIIGAGAAIGAIVALTAATPPKPPGAH